MIINSPETWQVFCFNYILKRSLIADLLHCSYFEISFSFENQKHFKKFISNHFFTIADFTAWHILSDLADKNRNALCLFHTR